MTRPLLPNGLRFMPQSPDAIILSGGAGLRLRDITGNGPKGLADIGGRPFLELLLRQLRRNGFHRAILAVGYGADAIRSQFGEHAFGLDLAYSLESSRLGTGGALRNAVELVKSDVVLVMNGDSYTGASLQNFVTHHQEAEAEISIVVVPVDGRADCGTVVLNGGRRLMRFSEKQVASDADYSNAGIYIVPRRIFYDIPVGTLVSLERELLPHWLEQGRDIRAFIWPGTCVDIGTPERYWSAQHLLVDAERSNPLP
jgi:NDP-sugar pyrophosphorylase family protein